MKRTQENLVDIVMDEVLEHLRIYFWNPLVDALANGNDETLFCYSHLDSYGKKKQPDDVILVTIPCDPDSLRNLQSIINSFLEDSYAFYKCEFRIPNRKGERFEIKDSLIETLKWVVLKDVMNEVIGHLE